MNIVGYLKKFGNLSFLEKSFNEVDALILSELSYCHFEYIAPSIFSIKEPIALAKVIDKKRNIDILAANTVTVNKNISLLKNLIDKTRFIGIKVGEIWKIFDEKRQNQFLALSFFLPDNSIFIAFRGTDITILGWKEDFNMSFLKSNLCQRESEEYFKYINLKYKNTPFYLAGHSKGGNLAFYVTSRLNKINFAHLIKAYSFDGPGFIDEVKKTFNIKDEELNLKLIKIVPQNSIIGYLLDAYPFSKFVKAASFSIFQHDPFNWLIKSNGEFLYVKKRTSLSLKQEKAMDVWLKTLTDVDKRFLVDYIYTSFGGNDMTIHQIRKKGIDIIRRFIKNYNSYTPNERLLIKNSFRTLFNFYKNLILRK